MKVSLYLETFTGQQLQIRKMIDGQSVNLSAVQSLQPLKHQTHTGGSVLSVLDLSEIQPLLLCVLGDVFLTRTLSG